MKLSFAFGHPNRRSALLAVAVAAVLALLGVGLAACRSASTPAVLRVVALGDSYAAGEGLIPFDVDSVTATTATASTGPAAVGVDTPSGDGCHRSNLAYARVAFPHALLQHRACSGAVIADLFAPQKTGGGAASAVNRWGAQLSNIPADTDVITLTIGGNDAGFVPVLTTCALTSDCPTAAYSGPFAQPGETLQSYRDRRLPELRNELNAAFRRVRDAAPGAALVVVGYPQLLPTGEVDTTVAGCSLLDAGFNAAERAWLAEAANALNDALSKATAQAEGYFVDAAKLFEGHEACGPAGQWVSGLVLKLGSASPIGAGSFHPNAEGQAALGSAVAATISALRLR